MPLSAETRVLAQAGLGLRAHQGVPRADPAALSAQECLGSPGGLVGKAVN